MHITTRPLKATRLAASFAASALLLGACGSTADPAASDSPSATTSPDATPSASESAADFPVTIEADNGPVVIDAMPMSIVSISPTSTEMLFAIGAGDQVVAVDAFSNYPEEAPLTDLSGFQPNIEAILSYEPDLVVIQFDPGDVVPGLTAAGVPVIVHDSGATLEDTYRQLEQLGAATGHLADAAIVVANLQHDLDEVIASLPASAEGLTYYHELDTTYFSATSSTFIGELYSLLGLVNIADAADPDGESFGYPQLSAEYIVDANPDLIFLADTKCCDATAANVAERDGWAEVAAVTTGGIVELDDDIASRWGPRVVEYLRVIADAINQLVAA